MILKDHRLKASDIAEPVNISKEGETYIFNEKLDMKESARWVLRQLTVDKKLTRMQISCQCLERFQNNTVDFTRRFITTDEA